MATERARVSSDGAQLVRPMLASFSQPGGLGTSTSVDNLRDRLKELKRLVSGLGAFFSRVNSTGPVPSTMSVGGGQSVGLSLFRCLVLCVTGQ